MAVVETDEARADAHLAAHSNHLAKERQWRCRRQQQSQDWVEETVQTALIAVVAAVVCYHSRFRSDST